MRGKQLHRATHSSSHASPSTQSQRRHVDWLATQLGISSQDQWYKATAVSLKQKGGARLFSHNDNTFSKVLRNVYPEYNWDVFSFSNTPQKTQNPRAFCDWFACQFGIVKQEDWYIVTYEALRQKGGSGLLQQSDYSLFKLLQAVYPEYLWYNWLFVYPSRNLWNSADNQRKCLDWLAEELNVATTEHWYTVTSESLKEKGGSSLLSHYDDFLAIALENIYQEYYWAPWLFPKVPFRYWTTTTNQRKYFDWLAELFEIGNEEDWESVRVEDIKSTGGMSLIVHYGNLASALRSVYPEKQWNSPERIFFDSLATRLGIENQADWYTVGVEVVREHNGASVLSNHGNLFNALQKSYPEYQWFPWPFLHTAHNMWNNTENHRKCIDWLADKFGIERPEQWYGVTIQSVKESGGGGLIAQHEGSLIKALISVYPEFEWNTLWRLSEGQGYIWNLLRMLVKCDVLLNHKLLDPYSENKKVELDVYIPQLELAFEYQGMQHYKTGTFGSDTLDRQQLRDEAKKALCKSLGITLIDIPYWWDNTGSALLSTLQRHRPDLSLPSVKLFTPIVAEVLK